VKPLGVAFDGVGIEQGTPQSLLSSGGSLTFDELVLTGQGPDHLGFAKVYRWRARVATNNPMFPHTAWFSVPGNNITEAKLRRPALFGQVAPSQEPSM
jgi:hypothetical protein